MGEGRVKGAGKDYQILEDSQAWQGCICSPTPTVLSNAPETSHHMSSSPICPWHRFRSGCKLKSLKRLHLAPRYRWHRGLAAEVLAPASYKEATVLLGFEQVFKMPEEQTLSLNKK